jgi:hypothetical protein
VLVCGGCADSRESAGDPNSIWQDGSEEVLQEPIEFAERSGGVSYGLPADGASSVADLIGIFPEGGVGFGEATIFSGDTFDGAEDLCPTWGREHTRRLPMTIDAVVTLLSRQYVKVEVCAQDERHYGSYVIEDDTGGIVVLRDSRIADFTYGDRVRMTVKAITLTFGRDDDTRAILLADVQKLPNADESVLFERTGVPFGRSMVSRVHQVEGWVHVRPTNNNFNEMVLTDKEYEVGIGARTDLEGGLLQCVRSCESLLSTSEICGVSEVWSDVCVSECAGDNQVETGDLPVCWRVALDAELGRRGFSPEVGHRVRATGPIVNSFDYVMWVLSLGQVEFLD